MVQLCFSKMQKFTDYVRIARERRESTRSRNFWQATIFQRAVVVKEYTGKRKKAVEERKGWSRAVNKRGIKGRRLDVLLCDIVRTYATTLRAANRGLRAEGIPRLPPLTLILGEATAGCATANATSPTETESEGWGQSTGSAPRVRCTPLYTHTDPRETRPCDCYARQHAPPHFPPFACTSTCVIGIEYYSMFRYLGNDHLNIHR